MTAIGLERALGMLLLDAEFCERFFLNPKSAVWEAGLPLSPIEVVALSVCPAPPLCASVSPSSRVCVLARDTPPARERAMREA